MCGIAGIYNFQGEPASPAVLQRMTDAIAHRGPDGEGHYTDGPVGLGFRRLAIIDLTPAGQQPMANETGDVLIIYNGEVYNFQELRVELQALGHQFRSRTDSEVVLHAYEEWGEACVERFNGMFAFAIYDRRRREGGKGGRLTLVRDRYGIKPLYYYLKDDVLVFASEIKALLEHPSVQASICYPALSEYFTFQNIFSDLTLFEDIRMLPPASMLQVDPGAAQSVRRNTYWDYKFEPADFNLTLEETKEKLFRLFEQAVTRQLVSDVPVGSYLSGGMDSGSITAVATRHFPRLHTFTCGFDLSSASGLELEFDERAAAERVASRLKTEHYEMVLHPGDMEYVMPELIWHLEDPRVGQSYPNYYVARLASKFVTVVLSGAGGDELFAGYPWRYSGALAAQSADEYLDTYYGYWQRLIQERERETFFTSEAYAAVKDHSPKDAFLSVFGQGEPPMGNAQERVNASLYFEIKTFLHGLFVVEDKLSMAHSLETRVPFLDNDLVDFAMRIPPTFKLSDLKETTETRNTKRQGESPELMYGGKQVLRAVMEQFVPPNATSRAKQGFSAPDASWFRQQSASYLKELLLDRKARINEFVNPAYVSKTLQEHEGGANHRLLIWSLLNFEWWLRTFLV